MRRDWFSPIEDLGSRLRRTFESVRAKTLPTHLRFDQEDIHAKEDLLSEVRRMQAQMLECIALALTVEERGVPRPLARKELRDMENPLIAVDILRSGTVLDGSQLLLDESRLPAHLFGAEIADEPALLQKCAEQVEQLTSRYLDLLSELHQLRTEFDSQIASR